MVPSKLQGEALETWGYDDFADACAKQKGNLPTAGESCPNGMGKDPVSKSQGPGTMWVPIKPVEKYKDDDRYKWMQIGDSAGGNCNPLSAYQLQSYDKQPYNLDIYDFGMYNGTYYYDINDTENQAGRQYNLIQVLGRGKRWVTLNRCSCISMGFRVGQQRLI